MSPDVPAFKVPVFTNDYKLWNQSNYSSKILLTTLSLIDLFAQIASLYQYAYQRETVYDKIIFAKLKQQYSKGWA